MLKVRLRRTGKKKFPYYDIVVVNARKPRDTGDVLDVIGLYRPLYRDPEQKVVLDKKKLDEWVSNGAQLTDVVKRFLKSSRGFIEYNDFVIAQKAKSKAIYQAIYQDVSQCVSQNVSSNDDVVSLNNI